MDWPRLAPFCAQIYTLPHSPLAFFFAFSFFLKSNFVFVEFATLLCYCNKRLKKVIFNLNRAIMYTKRNICRKYGR